MVEFFCWNSENTWLVVKNERSVRDVGFTLLSDKVEIVKLVGFLKSMIKRCSTYVIYVIR